MTTEIDGRLCAAAHARLVERKADHPAWATTFPNERPYGGVLGSALDLLRAALGIDLGELDRPKRGPLRV
jgi:hypothetical protein